ncbi:MAG: DHH family phosphoesterase, partial [Flavobacteriales bacterium]
MDRTWSIKEAGERELVEKLAAEINVDEIIANLLVQRNIHSFEDARKFFRPTMEGLHDPFLMKDMDKSVQRMEKAISGGERIMIYGDYDVDGTTAVALMFYCLSPFSQELICYIPDRYGEGYGISVAGIERAAAENVSLIIALDCGIKAADKVEFAKEKDIDLIICDHHTPGELIPDACAILNPKQPDCKYPNKELTGCGIGFKLLQAFHLHNNKEFETRDYALQLAAISTACDIVPMTDENRYITHFGLEKINALPIPGVKVLIDASKRKRPLNVSDLVFVIGPRLNSAGRMAHGLRSVELLLAKDEAEAIAPGQLIESLNAERRKIDLGTQDAALNLISKDMEMQGKKSTVLYDPEWHQGVLGIVASRLMDHYYRPTVLLTGNNGLATGSARSVRDFD